jgi:hypothetical protein
LVCREAGINLMEEAKSFPLIFYPISTKKAAKALSFL